MAPYKLLALVAVLCLHRCIPLPWPKNSPGLILIP